LEKCKYFGIVALLGVTLAGCDNLDSHQEEEKCTFRIKVLDDNEEHNNKADHAMFFLMYKTLEVNPFSRPDGYSDYVEFRAKRSCRNLLETLLGKM